MVFYRFLQENQKYQWFSIDFSKQTNKTLRKTKEKPKTSKKLQEKPKKPKKPMFSELIGLGPS